MKLPPWLKTYGDPAYRGDCPKEDAELITAVNWMRREHPDLAAVMVHIENEGKRTMAQAAMAKAKGLNTGAVDLVLLCSPPLCLELKRRDHTASSWGKGQQEFMLAAQKQGAFVGLCLGAEGVKDAVKEYLTKSKGFHGKSKNRCILIAPKAQTGEGIETSMDTRRY